MSQEIGSQPPWAPMTVGGVLFALVALVGLIIFVCTWACALVAIDYHGKEIDQLKTKVYELKAERARADLHLIELILDRFPRR